MAQSTTVNSSTRTEHVGASGIFPASGPWPSGGAEIREQGAFGHPDEREAEAWRDLGRRTRSIAGMLAQGYLVYRGMRWLTRRRPGVWRALITIGPFSVLIAHALRREDAGPGTEMVAVPRVEP